MVSVLHSLLLLWLSCGGTASNEQEVPMQVVEATESHTVILPCPFDPAPASDYLHLSWSSPSGDLLFYTYVQYLQSGVRLGDMWGLLIYNISRQDDVWFTCQWNGTSGTKHTLTNRTARQPEFFPCDAPMPNNWTEGSLSWVEQDSLAQETTLVEVHISLSPHHRMIMKHNTIFLIIPSVTFNDTGNYTCEWKEQKRNFQLKVKSAAEQADAFSYENVLPDIAPGRNDRRLLQKGKILPNTINTEDDDNYENTQEEGTQGETVVKESHTVILPCPFDPAPASDYLHLSWSSPSGNLLFYTYVQYLQSGVRLGDMWGLLIYNISRQDDVWFTCQWNGTSGTKHTLTNRTARQPEFFPCDAPMPNNWTEGSLSWVEQDSLAQETTLVEVHISLSPHHRMIMKHNTIFLIIPSVTFNDTGNYTCEWKEQKRHFQLKVKVKSAYLKSFWQAFEHQHWIIWTVALGCMVFCLGSLLCFLWLRRVTRARKQQMKLRSPARRRYFGAKRNKAHISNGIVASPATEDATEQADAFSYENVLPDIAPGRNDRRLLQKGKILPNTINTEDEEVYECPDSEIELKSDDDDNYENTQEEGTQRETVVKDVSLYENRVSKVKSASHNLDSVDACYANKSPEAPKILSQDPVDEADGENYENLEEESPLSPGASRLIAGLRLHLSLDPHTDRQDGSSEASTGSQSYEEMNGSLSPTAIKPLHLQPNTSNEEDADSYENMESPNSFHSRNEGNLDPRGEGMAFGSPWQHLPIASSAELRGGRLCSD